MLHSPFARLATCVSAALLFALPVAAGPRPELDVTASQRPSSTTRALAANARANATLLRVATPSSFDERYGVPTFLWATRTGEPARTPGTRAVRTSAEAAARGHLGQLAGYFRLQTADVAEAPLRELHDTGRGGVIAAFTQRLNGVDVFRDEVKVLMDRDLGLLAVSGYLPSRDLLSRSAAAEFTRSAEDALGIALSDFAGTPVRGTARALGAADAGGYRAFDVSALAAGLDDPVRPARPSRVKPVWFHMPDALVPAYSVELMSSDQAYLYVVSASDGTLLFRHDLMAFDTFNYRVWAQTAGARLPHDGPQGTSPTPHPTGLPDNFAPPFIAPSLASLQNGPISTNDPWLAPGATVTTGNNVDAYADLLTPDGFSAGDLRATTTSANTFDRTYDVNQNPSLSSDQRMAAITQLFYNNNFFHDWYYDNGFNEAAGNGQTNNFGRGGLGNDAMLSEAQDFSGLNNANMSTPPDGSPGRMQMFVFTPAGVAQLTANTPPSVAGTYAVGVATGFGPQSFTLTGDLILAVDNAAPSGDGCSAYVNSVTGKIVVVDRGTCTFLAKVQGAQAAGAIGVVIVDNVSAATPPGMAGSAAGVTIPSVTVTLATGNALKAAMTSNTVNVTLTRQGSLSRDGALDNQIVAHEWGHFISNRLVGNAAGLSTNMAGGMGEGWADFHAMLMTVRPEDVSVPVNSTWNGVYGLAGYALTPSVGLSNAYYFGIRRVPYSTDFTKNALTFKHITNNVALPAGVPTRFGADGANNAEVHNTGEVWCTMLWECYAALLNDSGRLTFAAARERMKDYIVAGYKLTPNAPTLTEARDAILAAALANDATDFQLMWAAFARRGIGAGAVSPDRFSSDNAGVVESFVTGGALTLVSKSLSVNVHDCDADGYLDNGEVGRLTVTLKNSGSAPLTNISATLSSGNLSVQFPSGTTFSFPDVGPLATTTLQVPVELSGQAGFSTAAITVTYNDPALAVPGPYSVTVNAYVNADEVPASNEDVETLTPPWTAGGTPVLTDNWSVIERGATDHRFFGADAGDISDHTLISPPLQVAGTGSFSFTFSHVFSFERDATSFYDGGVVEISNNNGTTWTDIGAALSTPYSAVLFSGSGNPLSGRSAYAGTSAGYPSPIVTTANLGTTYQGQTVRVRFRVATDAGVGGPGWEILNVNFSNLTNQPFQTLAVDAGACAPVTVDPELPQAVALSIAGANPARGSARFRFGLPATSEVELAVYDVSGRRVATLAQEHRAAGWHTVEWRANDDGRQPANGVYFARLRVGGQVLKSRLVMMR